MAFLSQRFQKKKKNYELSLVDRDSEIITHNLESSDQTQIYHISVQSKQYSVHPSRETLEEKDFEENLILNFTVTRSTWMHGSKCFIFRIKK